MATGIGIDIGLHSTRVARLVRRRGSISWAGCARASTGADELAAKLKEAGIGARGGVVGLSGKDAIIRYSNVPPAPAWKLRMLVGYAATQGGELDVSFDYRLLNLPARADQRDFTVMTAVAKNDVLSQRLGALTAHGVKRVDFAPDALALYEVFARCPEADESLDQYCLVLDIGASKTEMIIVYNGGLIFARSVAFGGQDFTKAVAEALGIEPGQAERLKAKHGEILEHAAIQSRPSAERPLLTALADTGEEFFGALRASLMFARAQTKLVDLRIGRVYLSGAGARLKGIASLLSDRLEARATPFSAPDQWQVPAKPGRPSEWMIALGLALLSMQPSDERVALLPPAARNRRRFWRRDFFTYAACALFLVFAAVGTTVRLQSRSIAKASLEVRRELAGRALQRDRELTGLAQKVAQTRDHLRLLDAAVRSGSRLAGFLERVRETQQGPVVLSSLRYEPGPANQMDDGAYVILSGTVGQSERKHHDVLTEFSQDLVENGDELKLIEAADLSADRSAMRFRLKIPLAAASSKDEDR